MRIALDELRESEVEDLGALAVDRRGIGNEIDVLALEIAVEHAGAMHVVELETLHLRAVDERSMRRRKLLLRAPHAACRSAVQPTERFLEDPAPGQMRAVERAAERIEHEELDARAHFNGYRIVGESRDELCNASGIGIVAAGVVRHRHCSCPVMP